MAIHGDAANGYGLVDGSWIVGVMDTIVFIETNPSGAENTIGKNGQSITSLKICKDKKAVRSRTVEGKEVIIGLVLENDIIR